MNRKTLALILTASLALLLAACTVSAEERTGEAMGYGGPIRVAVTMDGSRISTIRVVEHHETEDVGGVAIDKLPQLMVNANTSEVDGISGATMTSNALKAAVRQAMSPSLAPASPDNVALTGVRSGTGVAATGRIGPGVDANGDPIYSLNIVTANVLFGADDRIVHLDVDQLELASPGASGMAQFNGWPARRTEEASFLNEPSAWRTKREQGDSYRLNSGSWAEEMDAFERLFTGMTMAEVEQWYATHCSDTSGKPLTAASLDDDAAKWSTLSDAEKAALTDVTSIATMSLRGVNGDILGALQRAWKNAK